MIVSKEKLKTPKKAKTSETKTQPTPLTLPKRSFAFSFYPLILILLVGILSYSNTLHGPFIFDDTPNIVKFNEIHLDSFSASKLAKLGQAILEEGRPVARASFALNYYLGELNTFGYHLVNLLIHLLTAILVYLFLQLTLSLPSLQERYGKYSGEIALLSSLIFVAHPIQTQAVSYIVQRMASMAALFFLLALYCYAKARLAEGNVRIAYFAGSALATLLAFGSKENTITLPFFIVLYEYYFWQRVELGQAKKKWLYTIIGLILLAGLLAGIYIKFDLSQLLAGYKIRTFTPGQRMLTQLRVVIFYLSLLIAPLPSRLNLDYHFPLSYSLLNPPTTLVCFFLVLGLIAGSIYLAKKRPLISFALIWFWGNLVLESSFLPLELVFEHRLYLPSLGFFLLTSIILIKGIERLKTQAQVKLGIKAAFLLALIVPLSIMTYQRNKVWQDEVLLWEDAVNKSPLRARAYTGLGNAYLDQGRLAEAIAQYQRALEINPKCTHTYYNLGNVYRDQGRLAEAIVQFQRTLQINPGYKGAHNNLAGIYHRQGKVEQAIAELLAEIKISPDNTNALFNLGNVYRDQKRLAEAIAQYQRVLEIAPGFEPAHNNLVNIRYLQGKSEQPLEIKTNPGNAAAHMNLGNAYWSQGRLAEAIAQYQRALEIDPEYKGAHNNLAGIYHQQGKPDQAISEVLAEIKISPDNAKTHFNLGNAYWSQGRLAEAIAQYQRALEIDPGFKAAHNNLGKIYIQQGKPEQALAEFLAAVKYNPDNAKAHKNLGGLYLNTGNPAKTLFHFKKSLALAPQQPQASKMRQFIKEQQKHLSP